MREAMNESQVRKVLDKAGQHNHEMRGSFDLAKPGLVMQLEKDCPRCAAIRELLKRSGT